MLRIDFLPIKQALRPNPKKYFTKIRDTLPGVVKKRIEESKTWLTNQISRIDKPVYEPDPFVEQVKAISYINDTIQDVSDDLDLYGNFHRICEANNPKIDITKEDQSALQTARQLLSELRNQVSEAQENTDRNKDQIKQNIKKQIPLMLEEVKEYNKKIMQNCYLDRESDGINMLRDTKEFVEKTTEFNQRAKKYMNWQDTLGMEVYLFPEVDDIV